MTTNDGVAIDFTDFVQPEFFQITPQLRWINRRDISMPSHYDSVLQQLWQGSNGAQRWEDVPTVRTE